MKTTFAPSGRYKCLLDPAGHYVIWDNLDGAPCMTADGNIQAFAMRANAVETLNLLNRRAAEHAHGETGAGSAIPAARGSLR